MGTPCFQHDSYQRHCGDCRDMNGDLVPMTDETNPVIVERVAQALYEHWVSEQMEDDWAGWKRLGDKQTWLDRAQAALEAMPSLVELREALTGIKWKSADRDNMEFEARITYYQMDKLRALAKGRDVGGGPSASETG